MDWTELLEQQNQTDQQLADVLATRRARKPRQFHTGWGALLGGLGEMLSSYKSGEAEKDLREQRLGLSQELGKNRQEWLGSLMNAQKPVQAPPSGVISPDYDPQAAEQERQQNLQQVQQAGMLSGDPMIGQYLQHAPQMELQQENIKKARLDQEMEKLRMASEGPQADLGGKTKAIFEALTKRQEVPKFAPNPVSGALYNVRTGAETAGAPGGSAYDKRLPMMQEKFAKDLDPNNFRSGVLKGNQERANAAERLLQLAVDPITGGPADLNPQQMTELSTSLAALLSGGGGGSEGQRHELTPYTKGRSFANLMQWLTDKPQGADQKAFVQQMIDTAKREKGVVEGQIRGAQSQRFANHLPFMSMFPDAAKSQLQAYGFDPSEVDFKTGKYSPKPKMGAGGGGQNDRDAQAVQMARERLQRNPNDATAKEVLRVNGVQ